MNKIEKFTGIPKVRNAAMPSIAARVRNGRHHAPKSGLDWLLYGVISPIHYTPGLYSRRIE